MILNSQIWKQTVAAAILAATGQAAWIRAIERAVKEIEKSAYWSFDGVTLTIKSTTSGKLYKITAEHTCEATANGFKACKHKAALRLMLRYSERLALSEKARQVEQRKPSMLAASAIAPLQPPTLRGEVYNGMDV